MARMVSLPALTIAAALLVASAHGVGSQTEDRETAASGRDPAPMSERMSAHSRAPAEPDDAAAGDGASGGFLQLSERDRMIAALAAAILMRAAESSPGN